MDQDSFRQLLSIPGAASTSTGRQRGSLFPKSTTKPKTVDASEPAFKPRKVKKQSLKYRDRASERREGLDHDFAEVEAVLEDFEKRNKDNEDRLAVEEQRKYLGGDSDHSILVKGLDFALLEQNKAKVAIGSGVEDDESLEQAFFEAASTSVRDETVAPSVSKKTKRDLIQQLKQKREKDSDRMNESVEVEKREVGIEEAKKAGKFRPIGFKPIGGSGEKVTKRKKKEKDGERKPKKRKVEAEEQPEIAEPAPPEQLLITPASANATTGLEPEPENVDPDFDIFADAAEYTGLDIDSEDETDSIGESKDNTQDMQAEPEPPLEVPKRGWFDEPKEPTPPLVPERESSSNGKEPLINKTEADGEQPLMRLAPLASSSIPSVKDILAMDDAAEKAEKKKARKEKRKEKKELSAEGKASRDYQKLMAYEKKKSK